MKRNIEPFSRFAESFQHAGVGDSIFEEFKPDRLHVFATTIVFGLFGGF